MVSITGTEKPSKCKPYDQCNKKVITQNSFLDLKFSYVKGHSGSLGNNIADELANEASKDGEKVFVPFTKSFICRELHKKLIREWNNNWNKEGKLTYTYTWIKNIQLIPIHFQQIFFVTGFNRTRKIPFLFCQI